MVQSSPKELDSLKHCPGQTGRPAAEAGAPAFATAAAAVAACRRRVRKHPRALWRRLQKALSRPLLTLISLGGGPLQNDDGTCSSVGIT